MPFQRELDLVNGAHVNAHINLCLCYKDNRDSVAALGHIKSALNLDPKSQQVKDLYFELGSVADE